MSSIIAVLIQNILPIFIVASFGFALQHWFKLEKQSLTSAVFNCFSPCLVFTSLVNSKLPSQELFQLSLFAFLSITAMGILGLVLGWSLGYSREEIAALMVVVMFGNSGNYGLTLNQIRYGDEGLARAVVYYVTGTIIIYTVGVFIASAGKLSAPLALRRLFTLPPVYATLLALLFYAFHWQVPAPIMRGLEVAGSGAIPVMLLLLGMQLADLRTQSAARLTFPAIGLRLLIGPLVAVAVALFLGLQGLGRSTSIIEASMPTAVITIILATEFGLPTTAVTRIVALATLFSPFTIALTITLLHL